MPGSPTAGTRGWLRRRATLRPDVRAAIALEEAGELLEAARVFEYAGEHGQAALLRLEIARTLRDRGERLDVLREGCARNPGSSPEGRLLHLALAESLLAESESAMAGASSDPAARRALQLEAARALEEADDGGRAGELYESLGLLGRAAAAYERGGEISRLEVVLAVLDRRERREAETRAIESEVDDAVAEGRRAQAHALLVEHVRSRERHGRPPESGLAARLRRIEQTMVRGDRVDLRWGSGRVTAIRGAMVFRIGRAPDAQLLLPIASMSRHHVELQMDASGERPRVAVLDLGSRTGSFWNGDALMPGEPIVIDGEGELGLGSATMLDVMPIVAPDGSHRGAVVRPRGESRQYVYLPGGGPLWLAHDIVVPARVLFDRGWVVLDLGSGIRAALGERDLSPGAAIELALGDHVKLRDAPLALEVLG
jgi:hypothetical protein